MTRYFISSLKESFSGESFLLLCSSSFEKRCLSIPRIAFESQKCLRSFVCVNEENLAHVGPFAESIRGLFGDSTERVKIWGSDPVRTADSIFASVRQLLSMQTSRIVVDISAMMRETLLILLASLKCAKSTGKRIQFAYVPAEYNPSRKKEDRPILSFGAIEVRSVLGYPGDYVPTLPRHLILLTGFEEERARAVINATEPSIISLGRGERNHSTSEVNAALDHTFTGGLLKDFAARAQRFEIYPDSAHDTASAIIKQIESFPGYKPLICAMNTKVSTCGAAVAAWQNHSVELLYAQPALYNYEDYAEPKEEIYLFDLPLGD